ncbi:hypothetical protein [Mesorhizobium sp. SEMIA 3007]|uniref:hypothetical protein n=1 Tax=Mesorhizobium sp. SEMIA 3007 TaxID=1862350 RepID=UPI000AA4C36C|nr:hypothetical protein [Mesorhizobium sp. SEMIA 3007]
MTLKLKQPSVSKIEKRADMYLPTLKGYIEAIRGDNPLIVASPRAPLGIEQVGDI